MNDKINKHNICTLCKINVKQISWVCSNGMIIRKPLCKKCEEK